MKITKKQLVTTLLASTFMAFASTAIATPVNIAAGGTEEGDLNSDSAVTLGANAVVCGNIEAPTVTLGADAFVSGNIDATTVTLGAGAVAFGTVSATTLTLGAAACYGSEQTDEEGNGITTITAGAGASIGCSLVENISDVSEPYTADPNIAHFNPGLDAPFPDGHGVTAGSSDDDDLYEHGDVNENGTDHSHVPHTHPSP
jgi:cytoskeletal protein CcmA (bactofilin family)